MLVLLAVRTHKYALAGVDMGGAWMCLTVYGGVRLSDLLSDRMLAFWLPCSVHAKDSTRKDFP
jgi:hypothetical protein